MSKKAKRPTPERLAVYRSKSIDGSHIGKNQLAEVFAEIDHLVADNDRLKTALWDVHGTAEEAAMYTDVSTDDAVVNIRDNVMAVLNNE